MSYVSSAVRLHFSPASADMRNVGHVSGQSRRLLRVLVHPRLRTKLIIGVVLAACVASGLQFAISWDRVNDNLAAVEAKRMREDLEVARGALDQMQLQLERVHRGRRGLAGYGESRRNGQEGLARGERHLPPAPHVLSHDRGRLRPRPPPRRRGGSALPRSCRAAGRPDRQDERGQVQLRLRGRPTLAHRGSADRFPANTPRRTTASSSWRS